MENNTIAEIFNEIADMVSIEDKQNSRFEVRAYRKVALTISSLQEPIEDIYRKGGTQALMSIPGIGKGLAGKIEEFIKTGKISKYEMLKKKYPIDFNGLTSIQGMGAKKAVVLYKKLGIKNVDDLKKAIENNKIRELDGFGDRSEELIKRGLELLSSNKGRILLGEALPEAENLVKKLEKSGLVERVEIAGSTRRMRETIGDIDILAISEKAEKVIDYFEQLGEVKETLVKGPTKISVVLKIGLNCDLRVLESKSFGAALQYFTGSKDHGVQVRTIAVKKNYKLNEYGLFDKDGKVISSKSEEEIYKILGMDYVPAEMREARGEVKLAQEHKIPNLIELSDIKGDMHTHTVETDGTNTLEEMVNSAIKNGLKYIAVTNHTKSLKVARGMDDNKFLAFFKKIDSLNEKLDGKIRILKGAEIDILKDGSLDLESSTIREMDCAIGAIHSYFNMEEIDMTKRVIKAMDSGLINILAHPTGRLINERAPYKIDMEALAEAAERNGVALEIDAFPNRLDLNDTNIMAASKYKIKFSIDSDAHSYTHFGVLRYGVGTARRGWLAKNRVINTIDLKGIQKILSR